MTDKAHKTAQDIAYALLTVDMLYFITKTTCVTCILEYNFAYNLPESIFCSVFDTRHGLLYNSVDVKQVMDMAYLDYKSRYSNARPYYKGQT